MKIIRATDARENLVQLILQSSNDQEIVIVNRGKPLARLDPVERSHDIEAARAAIRRMRERAKKWGISATPEEVKSWVEDGRP